MTEMLQIEIVRGVDLAPLQRGEVVGLCTRAYDQDFGDILDSFEDATHVLGYRDGRLASHALWIPRTLTYRGGPLHSAYIEAVATEPSYQGCGYASYVLRALAGAIESFDVGALSPSDPAFYTRLGWQSWCGPLAVAAGGTVTPTPDGSVMILRLPNTPSLDLDAMLIAPWRAGDIW